MVMYINTCSMYIGAVTIYYIPNSSVFQSRGHNGAGNVCFSMCRSLCGASGLLGISQDYRDGDEDCPGHALWSEGSPNEREATNGRRKTTFTLPISTNIMQHLVFVMPMRLKFIARSMADLNPIFAKILGCE